ncbi:hypothetical protein KIN20_023171 [Parelaphostrongylus tenuis]|uniref:Uncharacterized protein n=1 Tax=Parelaphostrongylus tenuis TaxID=148309 RepID=A0AAD5QX65_PARTN|nr:hypothetical protein KIN20_023171 [Parelaphostrongylus tenuis]
MISRWLTLGPVLYSYFVNEPGAESDVNSVKTKISDLCKELRVFYYMTVVIFCTNMWVEMRGIELKVYRNEDYDILAKSFLFSGWLVLHAE